METPSPFPRVGTELPTGGKVMPQRLRGQRAFSLAYCNFAYSLLACFRMGMSGSASFQRVRKSIPSDIEQTVGSCGAIISGGCYSTPVAYTPDTKLFLAFAKRIEA